MAVGALTPRDQLDRTIALVRRSFRYAWVAALIGVLGTALAIAFALSRPRRYESRTVILHRELIPAKFLQRGAAGGAGSRSIAQRFQEVVNSAPLLQQVIAEHGLYEQVIANRGMSAAVEEARLAIKFHGGGGGTFTIGYLGSSPEEAQAVAAHIAELLMGWQQAFELKGVHTTKNLIDTQKLSAMEDLQEKERVQHEFLIANPEFAVSSADVVSGVAGAAVRHNTAAGDKPAPSASVKDKKLRALLRQKERVQALLAQKPTKAAPVKASPELRAAQRRQGDTQRDVDNAKRRLGEARARFTDSHPDVVDAKRGVALAQGRLAEAKAAVAALEVAPTPVLVQPLSASERASRVQELASINRDIAARRRALRGVEPSTPATDQKADTVVALEAKWSGIFRDVQEARQRYEDLEQKAISVDFELASKEASEGSQLSVVDPAFLPSRPAGTGRTILVLAGMVVFGGLGCVAALGLAFVDDRIVARYDIDKLDLAPVLGVIPKSKRKKRKTRA